MRVCWHEGCTNEATHTIASGEELCDLHTALLRALHDRRRTVLDDGLDGDAAVDLEPVDAAIAELHAAFVAPPPEAEAELQEA